MRKKKIKFLTVVWGVSYINQFCSLSLPSFLAPGNIPSLSERADLEVVIMTQRNDFKKFEKHKSFKLLKKICSVRFIAIDDLIVPDMYGVTLTLAYSRPIIKCGREMLNIHFIFMNADFVLADGSLLGLYKHIEDERAIVLGPSFRAIAEDVEPTLENYYDSVSGVLSIAPREMVGLSLPHPHKTTIAKYQNQTKTFSSHPNQFFWPVDKHTLLGRYYLIFMLALKPERVITSINSYCDYGLIPELCPSGDEVAMGDSDDFFMLELQNRDQELNILHSNPMNKKAIAQSLNEWTTKEHRRAASHNIIFHSKGIPLKIEKSKKLASKFIAGIKRYLLEPKSHAHHKYWVGGIISWRSRKQSLQEGKVKFPPEMGFGILGFKKFFTKVQWVNRKKLFQEGKVVYQFEIAFAKVEKFLEKGEIYSTKGAAELPKFAQKLYLKSAPPKPMSAPKLKTFKRKKLPQKNKVKYLSELKLSKYFLIKILTITYNSLITILGLTYNLLIYIFYSTTNTSKYFLKKILTNTYNSLITILGFTYNLLNYIFISAIDTSKYFLIKILTHTYNNLLSILGFTYNILIYIFISTINTIINIFISTINTIIKFFHYFILTSFVIYFNLITFSIFSYQTTIRIFILVYYNIVAEITSKHIALMGSLSVSSLMPGWLSYRIVNKTLSAISNTKRKEMNIFADDNTLIRHLFPNLKNVNWSSLKHLNHTFQKRIVKNQPLIIFVRDIKYKALTKKISLLLPKMTKGSKLFIYLLPFNDGPVNRGKLFLDSLNLSGFKVHKIESAGGKTLWQLNSLLRYFYRCIYPTNNNGNGPIKIVVRILATISILISLPFVWLVNSYLFFLQPKKKLIHHFRCVYIELRK